MAFVRVKKRENPYVQIDKRIFEDENLSWAAKGLMSYLLSRPDDWKINQTDLAKRSKCGETIVRSALLNLMENGYVYYYAEREKGKIVEWVYQVYESPEENPHREEAQKKAKEKLAERKKKQKDKSSKKADKSTFSPEREKHVVAENDLNSPEREILDVVKSDEVKSDKETLAYNKNDLNKNDLNKNNKYNNINQSKPKKKTNTYNKRTRTEIVPEWIKNEQKQEEQSQEFLERRARLQARLKEKYKKKNAQ